MVFIKTDVSLLRNVDTACREIQAKEDKVNLLFLTSSFLSFDGRNGLYLPLPISAYHTSDSLPPETSEGIDKRLCLNYYSRMRFVHNLLPQLTAAANDAGSLSRVVSVLSAGHEGPVVEDDLELKRNFSFVNCRNHGCVMNDFACEELAKHHPGTAFLHVYPGLVRTGILDHGGLLLKVLGRLMMTLLFAMEVSAHESGERNLFHASAPLFAPRATAGPDAAMGSDGTRGSGAYLLNWDGKPIGNAKVLDAMRQKQLGQRIWEHTLEVFGRLEQQNHAQQS